MMTLVLACDRCEVEFCATDYRGLRHEENILLDARRLGWEISSRAQICTKCMQRGAKAAAAAAEKGGADGHV